MTGGAEAIAPQSRHATAYRVRFDEAGPDAVLRTSGFMRYAQDLAWLHSTALGFGREWYAERGLTWLVRAAELVVAAPAPMGFTVEAATQVAGIRRVFARRRGEFHVTAESPPPGQPTGGPGPDRTLAGWVNTDWVLIDARGALTRIPEIFAEHFGGARMSGSVGRIALPPTPPSAVHRRFAVRPHELDPMAHANNAIYIDWLEEAVVDAGRGLGIDARSDLAAMPRHYRVEYVLAVEPGAELDGAAWFEDGGWSYRLANAATGADLFRARLEPGDGSAGPSEPASEMEE
jgi:acyl-CoA thioesterase FadM